MTPFRDICDKQTTMVSIQFYVASTWSFLLASVARSLEEIVEWFYLRCLVFECEEVWDVLGDWLA